jgi:hypothetical protein
MQNMPRSLADVPLHHPSGQRSILMLGFAAWRSSSLVWGWLAARGRLVLSNRMLFDDGGAEPREKSASGQWRIRQLTPWRITDCALLNQAQRRSAVLSARSAMAKGGREKFTHSTSSRLLFVKRDFRKFLSRPSSGICHRAGQCQCGAGARMPYWAARANAMVAGPRLGRGKAGLRKYNKT